MTSMLDSSTNIGFLLLGYFSIFVRNSFLLFFFGIIVAKSPIRSVF